MANMLVAASGVAKYRKASGVGTDGDPFVPEVVVGAGEKNGIPEIGLTELVDKDDQVDQNDFSASVALGLSNPPASGELLSVVLVTTELDAGAIMKPSGRLIFLDADPTVAAGDTALTADEWKTAIGFVDVAASDWISDANGGLMFKQIAIPFHELSNIYAVWLHTDATSLNSAAGDDEEMHINVWYRRDS
jgi:hypothetical protein